MASRLTDIGTSLIALVVLSPIIVLITSINTLVLLGNPFFCQQRVGRSGRVFWMLKFRTMRRGSEQQGQLTIGKDKRVTPFGRFLRRYKLDEWPQLLNVLFGQMTLVGPRPEVPKYVELYSEEQREVLRWKPGLTDPAALAFINESEILASYDDPERAYVDQLMPQKLKMNLDYLRSRSWKRDMRVIWRTIRAIL